MRLKKLDIRRGCGSIFHDVKRECLVGLRPSEWRVIVDHELATAKEVELGALPVVGILAERAIELMRLALEVARLTRFGVGLSVDNGDNRIEQIRLRLTSGAGAEHHGTQCCC